MGNLIGHAEHKEEEFDVLVEVVTNEFRQEALTEIQLRQALKKSFMLGHSAGHSRGEIYLERRLSELGGFDQ
ncbi:hypothetical protein [Oceanobacillus sp. FSL K6-0251]|uniref:hypothetical protein n=1 Tax=Oceanobacillus sp. FSL K6-0251 TaxID=2921602 RepID=UPI0030F6E57B